MKGRQKPVINVRTLQPATYKNSKGCVIIMLIVTFGRWGKNKKTILKNWNSSVKSAEFRKREKTENLTSMLKYSMNLHLPNGEISQSLTPSCTASKAVWGEYSATLFSKHLVTILSWKLSKVEIKIWRIFWIHFGSFTTPSKTWTWFFSRVEKSEDDTIKSNRLWLEDIHP